MRDPALVGLSCVGDQNDIEFLAFDVADDESIAKVADNFGQRQDRRGGEADITICATCPAAKITGLEGNRISPERLVMLASPNPDALFSRCPLFAAPIPTEGNPETNGLQISELPAFGVIPYHSIIEPILAVVLILFEIFKRFELVLRYFSANRSARKLCSMLCALP